MRERDLDPRLAEGHEQPAAELTRGGPLLGGPYGPGDLERHSRFVEGLEWVNCRINTVRGPVISNWRRTGARIAWTVELPVGSTTEVGLPAASPNAITESGPPLGVVEGVEAIAERAGLVTFRLASGRYRFVLLQ